VDTSLNCFDVLITTKQAQFSMGHQIGFDQNRAKVLSHLWEVSNEMASSVIVTRKYVEQKWFYIIIQCLVIQKKFCQQA